MLSIQKRGFSFGQAIGKGSFCKVLKAEYYDKKAGKKIELVCKLIDKTQATAEFTEKFIPREIQTIVRTSNKHPFIIEIHSIFISKCSVFVFMRWAENGDLLHYIQKHKKVKEAQVNLWAYQMVSALQYLHGIGYAHRDLKLENIFLTKHNNIRLGDFGFARLCDEQNGLSTTFCGTESYTAPEIIKQIAYDPKKSDIWSLGVVIFTLLHGTKPFTTNDTTPNRDQKNKKRSYILKQDHNLKLSAECLQLLQATLEPAPEKRPDINMVSAMAWLDKQLIKVPDTL